MSEKNEANDTLTNAIFRQFYLKLHIETLIQMKLTQLRPDFAREIPRQTLRSSSVLELIAQVEHVVLIFVIHAHYARLLDYVVLMLRGLWPRFLKCLRFVLGVEGRFFLPLCIGGR